MEMNLEIVCSVKAKLKKPCTKFAWLQQCGDKDDISEGLFLLEGQGISQISLATGRTMPSLSGEKLALVKTSQSGTVVAGITLLGHMSIWRLPSLQLATYTTPLSSTRAKNLKGSHLFVSDSGEQAVLVTKEVELHLWDLKDGLHSEWWKLPVPDDIRRLLSTSTCIAIDANFYVHQVLGECCECDIVFTNQETGETTIANLILTWNVAGLEPHMTGIATANNMQSRNQSKSEVEQGDSYATTSSVGSTCNQPALPVTIDWKTCTVLESHSPPHHTSHGGDQFVVKLSPTGRVVAVAVNHQIAANTHILFMDLWNEVSTSSPVYPKRSHETGRSWWVSSLAWSGDGLLLVAMTHRGCLMVLPRFGPPLMLVTSGCGLNLGPNHFLSLHHFATTTNRHDQNSLECSGRDSIMQRFSLVTHPCLPALLCSDGYFLTILRLSSVCLSLNHLATGLANTGVRLLAYSKTVDDETKGCFVQNVVHELGNLDSTEGLVTTSCHGLDLRNVSTEKGGSYAFRAESKKLDRLHDIKLMSDCERNEIAHSHLLSAWGLLLSASSFQLGNGLYPHQLSSNTFGNLSSDMTDVKNRVITAVASTSAGKQGLFLSALSMSFLDQLDQKSHKLVYALTNCHLLSLLSCFLQKHMEFASCVTKTIFAVETYAKHIPPSLKQFLKMFQKVTKMVAEIYSLSHADTAKVFSLPLQLLRRICSVLSRDLLDCNGLVLSMLPSNTDSLGLQSREAKLMQGRVAEYLNKASGSVANTINVLTQYCSNTQLLLRGCATREDAYSQSSTVLERVPHFLQKCLLRQALQCVYGLIAEHADTTSLTCHLSVPGVSLVPSSVLAQRLVSYPLLRGMLQLLAKFMAAFFCNESTKTVSCSVPRMLIDTSRVSVSRKSIEVAYRTVEDSISKQNLSDHWTPTHVVELFLLCGMWGEAAKLAVRIGDWKKGLSLAALYPIVHRSLPDHEGYCDSYETVVQIEKYAHRMALGKIVRELGLSRSRSSLTEQRPDPDLHFLSDLIMVCETGGMSDIFPQVSLLIHQRLWAEVATLPVRVPDEIPLPATPLYCTTALADTQDSEEGNKRVTLARLVRSSLVMLCGTKSLKIFCGWYCSSLVQLHSYRGYPRHRTMPSVDGTITALTLPSSFLKFVHSDVDVSHRDQCQMAQFRELCGLLWLFHVRDKVSHHIRKVVRCESNKKEVCCESDKALSELALWCARLLPLRHCHKNPSVVQDLLLSALSELPSSSSLLLAILLAQNFPDSSQEQSGPSKLKLDQLLARIRGSRSVEGLSLSVDHQVMSQTVLQDQASSNLQVLGPLCIKSPTDPHTLSLSNNALQVGSFIFEYDQAYLDFLDELFSMLLANSWANATQPHPAEPLTHTLSFSTLNNSTISNRSQLPLLPLSERERSTSSLGLYGVATYLYEWSQRTDSRPVNSTRCEDKKKSPRNRVEFSLSFLKYCLQLEEKRHQLMSSQEVVTRGSGSPGDVDTFTSVTAVPDQTASTMTCVPEDPSFVTTLTSVYESTKSDVSSGEQDDTSSITTITPIQDGIRSSTSMTSTITPEADSTVECDSTLHTEDLDVSDSTKVTRPQPFQLLNPPKNWPPTLEKQDYRAQELTTSVSENSLRCTLAGNDETVNETPLWSMSSGQLVSDADLTDSQSTGEIPSQMTFSAGELGSWIIPATNAAASTRVLPLPTAMPIPAGGVLDPTPELSPTQALFECFPTDPLQGHPTVINSPLHTDDRDVVSMHSSVESTTHSDTDLPPSNVEPHQSLTQDHCQQSEIMANICTGSTAAQTNTPGYEEDDESKTITGEEVDGVEVAQGVGSRGRGGNVCYTTPEKRPQIQLNAEVLRNLENRDERLCINHKTVEASKSENEEEVEVETNTANPASMMTVDGGGSSGSDEVCNMEVQCGREAKTTSERSEEFSGVGSESTEAVGEQTVKQSQERSAENDEHGQTETQNLPLSTEPQQVSQSITRYLKTDFTRHVKDAVTSELKHLLQEQHQQMMNVMLEVPFSPGRNENTHARNTSSAVHQNDTSSTGYLTLQQHASSYIPPHPLLLLPKEPARPPLHLTPSSQLHTLQSPCVILRDTRSQNIPLLQLDDDGPVVQGVQLPSLAPVRPVLTPHLLPLLSSVNTKVDEPLIDPVLPHIPRVPLATSLPTRIFTPLLHFPSSTSVHMLLPPKHTTLPPAVQDRPLPLLVPDSSTIPTLPTLITVPPPPVHLLPDMVHSCNLPHIEDSSEQGHAKNPMQEDPHSVSSVSQDDANHYFTIGEGGDNQTSTDVHRSAGLDETKLAKAATYSTTFVQTEPGSCHPPQSPYSAPSFHHSSDSHSTHSTETPAATSTLTSSQKQISKYWPHHKSEAEPPERHINRQQPPPVVVGLNSGTRSETMHLSQTKATQTSGERELVHVKFVSTNNGRVPMTPAENSQFNSEHEIVMEEGLVRREEMKVVLVLEGKEGDRDVQNVAGRDEEGQRTSGADEEDKTEKNRRSGEQRKTYAPSRNLAGWECREPQEKILQHREKHAMENGSQDVLNQLRELQSQLTTIETGAKRVEGELLVSHELLGTIEELQNVKMRTTTPTVTAQKPHLTAPDQSHPFSAGVLQQSSGEDGSCCTSPITTSPSISAIAPGELPRPVERYAPSANENMSSSSPQPLECHRSPCPVVTTSRERRDNKSTQSQEHMRWRMEEAFTLMEEILSAKPLSLSLHTTTCGQLPPPSFPMSHHQAVSSCKTVYHNSSDGGIAVQKETTAGSPSSRKRLCSSVGLTPEEQHKMGNIMAPTEDSVSSSIDWDLVDQLIEN